MTESTHTHASSGLPAGFVDQAAAAQRLGVEARQLRKWTLKGKFDYRGERWQQPNGQRKWFRIYALAEVDAAAERMRQRATQARADWVAPMDGFVIRTEAARRLGVGDSTLDVWHAHGWLRDGGAWTTPRGRRTTLYATADIEALLVRLDVPGGLPDGFVGIDEARDLFGVSAGSWSRWKTDGRVPVEALYPSRTHGVRWIYAIDELLDLHERMRGKDKVFRIGGRGSRGSDGPTYHIPDGYVQSAAACAMLGVGVRTLERWEAEGVITCGRAETGRRIKIYPRVEIERLVAEFGRYQPPYADPDRPGVWRLPLAGEGILRREAIIDEADVPLLAGRSFHLSFANDRGDSGNVAAIEGGVSVQLRRLVLGVEDHDVCVGHRNDDPLDCRRENLVVRTFSERSGHARKMRTMNGQPPSSRFKGVCWDKSRDRWVAKIKNEGVSRHLGRFDDEIAAAEAYDAAARELFGEHARPNFPDGVDAWLEARPSSDIDDAPGDGVRRAA